MTLDATMGDQVSPDVQTGDGQQPPQWLQTFAQQMAQEFNNQMAHMAQRIDAIDQRTQAPPPVPPPPPPANPITVPPDPPPPMKRPKPVLPDPSVYYGKRSEWRTWKDQMISKLNIDGPAIGGTREQFAYIESRLGGTAAKTVLAFMKAARANGTNTPDNFLTYMENIYGDPNSAEHANNRLNSMTQGNEAFATFLPKFEQTLAEAGGSEWADQIKINNLKRVLSQELRTSLVYIPKHPEVYDDFVKTLQTLASRLAALKPRAKKITTTSITTNSDTMDWEPSINKVHTPVSGNEQKRAQWVSKDVLEERRSNNKCLRCGGNGHFVSSCKLLPARPPHQDKTKVKTTEVEDDTTVMGESESEPESGKE
jgi:hypothetical protein